MARDWRAIFSPSPFAGLTWKAAAGRGSQRLSPLTVAPLHATSFQSSRFCPRREMHSMNGVIYLVGLVVVVLFILSLLGLR
jgi:hypothetical protein